MIDEEREWKPTWQKVKICLQKAMESRRIEDYKSKEQQGQFYKEEDEYHLWLSQKLIQKEGILNHYDARTNGGDIIVESKGIGRCRVCRKIDEIVEHLVAECKVLANSEYL